MGMEDQRPIHIRPGDNRSEVILGWKDVYNMDDFLDRVFLIFRCSPFDSCINTMKEKGSCA